MPTMKPRISITLGERQHALLASVAALKGQSVSALVCELIDSVEPVLGRLEGVLQVAKDAPASVLADLRRNTELAENDVVSMLGVVGADFEGRPPTSNRGVGFSENINIPPKKTKTYRKSEKSGVK